MFSTQGQARVAQRGCMVFHPWSFTRPILFNDAALSRLLHCGLLAVLSNLHRLPWLFCLPLLEQRNHAVFSTEKLLFLKKISKDDFSTFLIFVSLHVFSQMSVIAWFWTLSFLKDRKFCWHIANHFYKGNYISPSTSCKVKGEVQSDIGSLWRKGFISKKIFVPGGLLADFLLHPSLYWSPCFLACQLCWAVDSDLPYSSSDWKLIGVLFMGFLPWIFNIKSLFKLSMHLHRWANWKSYPSCLTLSFGKK